MAGSAKPDNAGSEAGYILHESELFYGLAPNLFNGITEEIETQWWGGHGKNYMDITLQGRCNIWRLSNRYVNSHKDKLDIYKYVSGTWTDVTKKCNETIIDAQPYEWQKIIEGIEPGRYKFAADHGQSRIDTEWYLESCARRLYIPANSNWGMKIPVYGMKEI